MASCSIISYAQGVRPICSLQSVTFAVLETFKQYDVLFDFKVLRKSLETWAVTKIRDCGKDPEPNKADSDNEEYEGWAGIGRGFEPSVFHNASVERLENQTNNDVYFFTVNVELIGNHSDERSNNCSIKNYSFSNEHVVVDLSKKVSHCIYVVWMCQEGKRHYFLCRNSEEFGKRVGDRYLKVPIDNENHELYKISVTVDRIIRTRQIQFR